jgi:hypothetical protein
MSEFTPQSFRPNELQERESRALEAVTTCVGFSDMLAETLAANHPHVDTHIVVTRHDDRATQEVCRKHGATCVLSDLFSKDGRNFNKGAAINAGFDYFRFHGWRLHLDVDILLPDNFRRVLFNHTHLERDCLYGCDRVDVIGREGLSRVRTQGPQYNGAMVNSPHGPISHRWVDRLRGYVPLGFFQLWHCSTQKPYPWSLGTAAHDDLMFGALWPLAKRRHLASVICHHLCARTPVIGENWDGRRQQPSFQ